MIQLNELTNYLSHDFSEDTNNNTYKILENKYLEYLEQLAKENNWEIKKTFRNEFNFSMCIKSNNIVLVISILDVRKELFIWYDRVFIKFLTMDCEQMKHTNFQYYSSLPNLAGKINSLTNNNTNRSDFNIDDIF